MRLLAIATLAILFSSSCRMGYRQVQGNGKQRSEARNVGSFDRVELSSSIDLVLTQGSSDVRVEADENLLSYVQVTVEGNTLHVRTRPGYNLNSRSAIRVYASAPSFRGVQVTGSGDVSASTPLSGSGIDLDVASSGNISLTVNMPEVNSEISGSGTITVAGTTRNFRASVNSSGEIKAFNLLSEHTEVSIAGSGSAEVFASKQLHADVAGSGSVAYKGTASVNKTINGSGEVHKAD